MAETPRKISLVLSSLIIALKIFCPNAEFVSRMKKNNNRFIPGKAIRTKIDFIYRLQNNLKIK